MSTVFEDPAYTDDIAHTSQVDRKFKPNKHEIDSYMKNLIGHDEFPCVARTAVHVVMIENKTDYDRFIKKLKGICKGMRVLPYKRPMVHSLMELVHIMEHGDEYFIHPTNNKHSSQAIVCSGPDELIDIVVDLKKKETGKEWCYNRILHIDEYIERVGYRRDMVGTTFSKED